MEFLENTDKGIRLAYVRIDSLQSQYNYFQELVLELQAEEAEIVEMLEAEIDTDPDWILRELNDTRYLLSVNDCNA